MRIKHLFLKLIAILWQSREPCIPEPLFVDSRWLMAIKSLAEAHHKAIVPLSNPQADFPLPLSSSSSAFGQ